MENYEIYKDIASRTGGDIYIGVVGPVRSGKSTLVKKLTEKLVLPNIQNKNKHKIALDETPQSAAGKTVMTTEPKFVPSEAVPVRIDKTNARIRLIDCVGYMVEGAFFADEEGKPRMVKTPWSDEEMPFERAAEIGTEKVIKEHSTIALLVTSDGSFTDIKRSAYEAVEERVVNELKSADKPFIIVFNTKEPHSQSSKKEAAAIEKKFGVTTVCINEETMDESDVELILESVLDEFPISSFDIELPRWMQALPADSSVVSGIINRVVEASEGVRKMKDLAVIEKVFTDSEDFEDVVSVSREASNGSAKIKANARSGLFYKVLSESAGEDMNDEFSIMNYVATLAVAKKEYEKLKDAIESARETGYGIALPSSAETTAEKAEIIKRSNGYQVRVRAQADVTHLIRTTVHSSVSLISGTKEQCERFCDEINDESGEGMNVKIFGKPAYMLVNDNILQKSGSLSESVRSKITRSLSKAINEKKTNMICILL